MRLRYLVLLASLSQLVKTDLAPCTGEDDTGYYDLSPLKSKKDYMFTSETGRNFSINVCQSVKSELWNPQQIDKAEAVGGFMRGDRGDFSIGTFNTTVRVAHKHPLLVYENGSPCPGANTLRASTVIRFICDPAVFAVGSPVLVAQLPPEDGKACAFFVEWRTHVACPRAKSVGAGGFIAVFGAILMAALLTYLVGGTLYNRYVLGYRGLDQLPTISPLSLSVFTDCAYFFKDNFFRRDDGFVASGPRGGGFGNAGSGFGRNAGHPFGRSNPNGFGPTGGFGNSAPPPPRRDGFQALSQEERAPMLDARFSIDDDQEYERRTSASVPAPPAVPQKNTPPTPSQPTQDQHAVGAGPAAGKPAENGAGAPPAL